MSTVLRETHTVQKYMYREAQIERPMAYENLRMKIIGSFCNKLLVKEIARSWLVVVCDCTTRIPLIFS